MDIKLITITSSNESTLAKNSIIVCELPKVEEADYLKKAPTSSITLALVFGDCIAVALSEYYQTSNEQFRILHPADSIGKNLITIINDIMKKNQENAYVFENDKLIDAMIEIGKKGLGIVSVIDLNYKVKGIITDGDVRKLLVNRTDIYSLSVLEVMNRNFTYISNDILAVEALEILKNKNLNPAPVLDNNHCLIGTITIKSIIEFGIIAWEKLRCLLWMLMGL